MIKEIEVENVRFEPQGLPFSIQPAHVYWLRHGDAIAPRWDTHEFHWERKGAMCDFIDNTSTEDCKVCDYCNLPPSIEGPPCMGVHPIYFPGALDVVADSGFIQTDNPQVVLSYIFRGTGDVLGACANNTNPSYQLIFFEPATSGLYRLQSEQTVRFRGATNGEIKLHVVEKGAGLAQKTAYQLTRQTVDGANYWTWTIEGNPLWLENFSPNLRVTDIRILRGVCGDGSAQGRQCAIPNESVPVKPSRILFLPGFQGTVSGHPGESSHRCYGNQNASGGNFINLDSCRETYNANQTIQKPATPTYESDPAGSMEKLTWLVEFNINEGADADLTTPSPDPMPADTPLIIEFTIQAN
ncbi:MAG TPA: hypothetical protein VFY40_25065 [Blastocatellia bacterium]|nr:hypothetical protein [Blastocatellia bacterium]